MATYIYRKQAVEAAKALGYKAFRTKFDSVNDIWKLYAEQGCDPAAEWAKDKDFVHHTEVAWTDVEPPVRVSVIVVNVTKEEVAEEGQTHDDPNTGLFWLETEIGELLVEPLTRDLWNPDVADTGKRRSASGEPRERSTTESPVKVVWRIADEMAGSARKDVIAACVAAGVNKSTANTQYYHWQKKHQEGESPPSEQKEV